MIDVAQITALHRNMVELWHAQEIFNPCRDLLYLVCEQHKFNYLLWHEEDIARSPEVGDSRIAAVKRAIDRFNQQRNDATERIDDHLRQEVQHSGVVIRHDARWNTETPGSAIDRLSILALRIYHMEEQVRRADAGVEHVERSRQRLSILDLAARRPLHRAGGATGRHLRRPQTTEGLSPVQDVQRPGAQPVSLRGPQSRMTSGS